MKKKAVYIQYNYNYKKEKETRRKHWNENKEWLLLNGETISDHLFKIFFHIFQIAQNDDGLLTQLGKRSMHRF